MSHSEPRRRRGIWAAGLLLAATSLNAGSSITASNAALATSSPLATQAGLAVLRSGGNAIDAAVAVAFVLAVVQPQSGNIGGGGFLVYYDAKTKGMWALDFREVAPLATKAGVSRERTGPLAAGVPASVAGLAAAHDRFGSRSWKELLAPAIALARDGFTVDDRLSKALADEQNARKIDQFASTKAVFFPDGKPLAAGTKLVQKDLAATLERIAQSGASGFYRGDAATKIVDGIKGAGGIIADRDLRDYKPLWRSPLKIELGEYSIVTLPPPSSGGVVLAEALNILSGFDLHAAGFQTARTVHLEAEAERRASIDSNRYIGDPASSRLPLRQLLSPARADQWRASIKPARATPSATLTEPPPAVAEGKQTTHVSIVDRQGNIVSMTTTLDDEFGSGFVVPGCGFFLNDAMNDFSSGANGAEAGKRMASSMTPLIVMHDNRPFLVLGTPGGAAIPTTELQVLLAVIVFGKPLDAAIEAPRLHQQATPEDLFYEFDRTPKPLLDAIGAMGHGVRGREPIGDVQAIAFTGGRIVAVCDSRGGGAAGGF